MAGRSAGGPGATRLWARTELAARWRALVALGILAGLAAGLALAAVGGMRRTATAFDRFRVATAAPDAILFPTLLGITDQDYGAVVALPEVESAGTFLLAPMGVGEPAIGTLPPGDDQLYRTLSRPLLVRGRLPDPRRPDEIVVNRLAARRHQLRLGQQLTVGSGTDFNSEGPSPEGPTVRVTIVGIGDSMMDVLFFGDEAGFTPSPAILDRLPGVPTAANLVVRLRPGTDVAVFGAKAARVLGLPDLPVRDVADDRKRLTHSTDLERAGLALFAGAVALAGLVLVGQALARTVYAMAGSVPTLRALGFTTGDVVRGLVRPLLVTAGAAAVVSLAGAVAASGWFPVGQARRLDPDLGLRADWAVLIPGVAAVVALILAGGALAALRSARSGDTPATNRPGSALVRMLRRVAPVPVAIGAGLALEGRRGRGALPIRPAIAAAVAAVLGVVGALGLVRGIDDALISPARSGQVWDAAITPLATAGAESVPVSTDLLSAAEHHPGVDEVALLRTLPLDVDGSGLLAFTLEPRRGSESFVVLEGRAPQAGDEVALGPATATALRKGIGDRIQAGGEAGPHLRIVGMALLPQTPHSSFDQGVWITPESLDDIDHDDPGEEALLVTARSALSSATLVSRLHRDLDDAEVDGPSVPQDVLALRNVRSLPQALAAFLVVLGLAGLGHALVTAGHRRRHDLAVMRALGFRPRQSGACIAWLAVTVAAVGLVVGVPFGVVAGRRSWQWVADVTPLRFIPPLATVAVISAIPAALIAANLLAALPARRVARQRPAEDLRSE